MERTRDFKQLLMTTEAHFHLLGFISKHKMMNPQELQEKLLHSPKVTVSFGITVFGIVGPYLFVGSEGETVTMNSDCYIAFF